MPRRVPFADRTPRQQGNLRRTLSPGHSRRRETRENSQNTSPQRNVSHLIGTICRGLHNNERALRCLFIFLFEWGTLFTANDQELQNLLRVVTRRMDEAADAAGRALARTEQSFSRNYQR